MTDKFSLADFQRWWQRMLIDPPHPTDPREGRGEVRPIEAVIEPSQRLASRQRLAVYQHSYTARLRDCLAKQFTALEHALGPELFRAFADEYLYQYPSEHYNLARLGDRFADHLAATRPDRDAEIRETWPDFMIELARFEHSINELFEEQIDSEKNTPIVTAGPAAYRLVAGLRLYATRFPVRAYYLAVLNDRDPAMPGEQPTYCAAFRQDYRLRFVDLTVRQYRWLSAFLLGHPPIEEVVDILEVTAWCEQWATEGLVVR